MSSYLSRLLFFSLQKFQAWFYTSNRTSPNIYLFKVNNRNTRKRLGICSKLTIKTPERLRRRSSVFIGNFEHISHLFIVFYCWLWTRKCKLRSFQFCVNMSLIIKKFWKCFSQNQLLSKKEKEKLDFSCIILKNGQTYFENLAVWRPQVF